MKWTLNVKNYGKIEEASIEVNKITVLNGDNNSGKSYMMSLLYSLCSIPFYNMPQELTGPLVDTWMQKILSMMIDEPVSHTVTPQECSELNTIFNEWLMSIKDSLLQKTFNYPVTAESITVDFNTTSTMQIDIRPNLGNNLDGAEKSWTFSFIVHEDTRTPLYYKVKNDIESLQRVLKFMFDVFLDKCLLQPRSGVMFLPTSRTGFMLTFKELASNALNNVYSSQDVETTQSLTRPSLDFLKFISSLSKEVSTKGKYLADYIEQHMLNGRINVQTEPFINITYTPYGSDLRLPLSVTSAIITELAPLVIALRYAECNTLFIEEPEMCLHPKLQWVLGRLLVSLSHHYPIIMTTHSDLLMQSISNLVRMTHNPQKDELMQKWGYDSSNLLYKDDINVYQFSANDSGITNIKKDDCTEDGIILPSFDNAINDMYKETVFFTDVSTNSSTEEE